ncbi:MAG: AAA family ATPase [Calditrichaceae bacterium]|nr:AAA family ATPase [Calditrichaceae bacterium]
MSADSFVQSVLSFSKSVINDFIKKNIHQISGYLKDFKSETTIFWDKKKTPDASLTQYWNELENYYNVITEWIEKSDSRIILPQDEVFEQPVKTYIAGKEDVLNLPFPENLFDVDGKKSLFTGLSLLLHKQRFKRKKRKAEKKNPGFDYLKSGRYINSRAFLCRFLEYPLIEFLNKEYFHLSACQAKIIFGINRSMEKFKESLLRKKYFNDSENYWNYFSTENFESVLKIYVKDLSSFKNIIDNYEKEAGQRIDSFMESLSIEISKNFEIAGTYLLPEKEYNLSGAEKNVNELKKNIAKDQAIWNTYMNAAKEEWLKDIELSKMQFLSAWVCLDITSIVHDRIQEKIEPVYQSILGILKDTKNTLDENITEDAELEAIKQILRESNRNIIKNIRQQKLPELMDGISKLNISQLHQGFYNRFCERVEELSDIHILLIEKDTDHQALKADAVELSLKEILSEEMIPALNDDIQKINQQINNEITIISQDIMALDQIIGFSLEEAAGEVSDEDILKSKEIAIDAVRRTHERLEEFYTRVKAAADHSTKEIQHIILRLIASLNALEDSEEILKLKLRLARAKIKEQIRSTSRNAILAVKKILPSVLSQIYNLSLKIKDLFTKIRHISGIAPVEDLSDQFIDYALSLKQKYEALPFIYGRLFRIEPLESEQFFSGCVHAIAVMENEYNLYKNGRTIAMAIVGEKGSGKTTLINNVFRKNIVHPNYIMVNVDRNIDKEDELCALLTTAFNVPDIKTIEDMENYIVSGSSQYLCVLENMHRLFLRTIQGFAALERLLLLINVTRDKIMWIVTSGLYGWEYLDRVFNVSKMFHKVLFLDEMTVEELENVIIKRHQVSGFGLKFSVNDKITKQKQYRNISSDEERQLYLRKRFFKNLNEISSGNISISLLYWLGAIQELKEGYMIISPEITMEYSFLRNLTYDDLFTLCAIIQHEFLSMENHAEIFNNEPNESKIILNRLYQNGFIELKREGYFIHPLIYRAVAQILKSRNLLY